MERKRDINTYVYVLAVAKRVKQLLKGATPKVESKNYNMIKIAKDEIEKGKIIPVVPRDIIDSIDKVSDTDDSDKEESEA